MAVIVWFRVNKRAGVAGDDPRAVTVGRVFAELRGRDSVAVDLQGHGVVVDLG